MGKINEYGETLEQFLKNYDENKYRRPSNTVDMILFTVYEGNLKVLLVKRKNHVFQSIHTSDSYIHLEMQIEILELVLLRQSIFL